MNFARTVRIVHINRDDFYKFNLYNNMFLR